MNVKIQKMKSGNSASFRAPGQRSIPSTLLFRASHPCSSNSSVESSLPSDKNKRGSSLSLNAFLNRKLHTSSALPINKDENTSSVVKKESNSLVEDCYPPNASNFRDERHDYERRVDEKGCVIDASVFKLFNDSGGKVRKRSSECVTVASRFQGDKKQHSQNHLLVLGDDPKPKRRAHDGHEGVSCSNKKQKSYYNHYENGTGWWDPERVGVDSEEVGNLEMWEGMGTTTLGALDWH